MDRRNFLSAIGTAPLALALPNLPKSDTLPVIRIRNGWVENLEEVFKGISWQVDSESSHSICFRRERQVLTEEGEEVQFKHIYDRWKYPGKEISVQFIDIRWDHLSFVRILKRSNN